MLFPELQSLEEFEYIQPLGTGCTSNVDLYRHIQTNRKVAIKKFSIKTLTQSEARKSYENELAILTELKAVKNVVELLGYGFYTTTEISTRRTRTLNNYFLILEYIESTPLEKNSERIMKQFYFLLIQALRNIHLAGVVHRDLNFNNILVKNNEPVIIDFTFGALSNGKQKMVEFYGTKPYVAPEIIDGQSYYPYPTEIYSLGVILRELLTTPETDDIVQQMTAQNPYKRPSLEDIIAHPLFQF